MSGRGELPARLVDLAVASAALVVTAPLWPIIAVAVKLSSDGPVLHRAVRAGRHGEPFTLHKFRSMRTDAAAVGPGVTAGGDPRVTAVGRFLRRWKLDELPQLLDVLRGDMAIVGPRPEDPRYVATYTDEQRQILAWRPGITSPASVAYRNEEERLAGATDLEAAYREVMDEKIQLDLRYFRTRSTRRDLGVILRTALAVIGR